MRVNSLTPQDLKAYGINDVRKLSTTRASIRCIREELDPKLEGYERGVLTNLGAIAVDTGIFTGRSPKDKYIVRDDTTRDTVWWSDKGNGKNDNKPLSRENPAAPERPGDSPAVGQTPVYRRRLLRRQRRHPPQRALHY